jgi:hypothetical protein
VSDIHYVKYIFTHNFQNSRGLITIPSIIYASDCQLIFCNTDMWMIYLMTMVLLKSLLYLSTIPCRYVEDFEVKCLTFLMDVNGQLHALTQWSATGVPQHSGLPLHGIRCAAYSFYKLYLNIDTFTALNLYCIKLLNLHYLFSPICAFRAYAVGYEMYHHPQFLLTDLNSTECKFKFMKDLSIFKQPFHMSQQKWILN